MFPKGGSLLSGGLTKLLQASTAYVDQTNGSDSTGTVGRVDLPYLTIGAAMTAITTGTVIVVQGAFNEQVTLKTGVGIIFYPAAAMAISSASASAIAMFSDGGSAVTCQISSFSQTHTITNSAAGAVVGLKLTGAGSSVTTNDLNISVSSTYTAGAVTLTGLSAVPGSGSQTVFYDGNITVGSSTASTQNNPIGVTATGTGAAALPSIYMTGNITVGTGTTFRSTVNGSIGINATGYSNVELIGNIYSSNAALGTSFLDVGVETSGSNVANVTVYGNIYMTTPTSTTAAISNYGIYPSSTGGGLVALYGNIFSTANTSSTAKNQIFGVLLYGYTPCYVYGDISVAAGATPLTGNGSLIAGIYFPNSGSGALARVQGNVTVTGSASTGGTGSYQAGIFSSSGSASNVNLAVYGNISHQTGPTGSAGISFLGNVGGSYVTKVAGIVDTIYVSSGNTGNIEVGGVGTITNLASGTLIYVDSSVASGSSAGLGSGLTIANNVGTITTNLHATGVTVTANTGTIRFRDTLQQAASPVTTGTVTITNAGSRGLLYLTPAGTIAALTIANPFADGLCDIGFILDVYSSQIITAITFTGFNGVSSGTIAAANGRITLIKVAANTWETY